MNVIDKDGKQHQYPNRGTVVRCDPDGSNFEVYAIGVRNTHEFVFDDYGNLISVDNDGDHSGESERLVYPDRRIRHRLAHQLAVRQVYRPRQQRL